MSHQIEKLTVGHIKAGRNNTKTRVECHEILAEGATASCICSFLCL